MSTPDASLHALILACAHPISDPQAEAMIPPLLNLHFDVDDLVAQAGKHRILPLMHAHLQSISADQVPPGLMQRLTEHFYGQALNNYRLTQTLTQLLPLLEDHGIPAIPWKGPVLAVMAYGDIKMRPFTDLDLIVPESQIEQAKDLLCDHGYRLMMPMTKARETHHRRTFHAYTLLSQEGNECVDLHWRITQYYIPFPVDMNQLWNRLDRIEFQGMSIRCLSPEVTLLLLCVHGTVHRWKELGWLSDLACLITRFPQLDWEGVLDDSQRLNSERMVLLGLSLCHDLMGTTLPTSVQHRLATDPLVPHLTVKVKSRLWCEPATPWQRLVYYGLPAQTLERFSDRMRFWWRTASWVLGSRLQSKVKARLMIPLKVKIK